MSKNITLFIFISAILIQLKAQDSCLPLYPRIEFGAVYSDWASDQKILIKFNTRSNCSRSFVTVSNLNGNIRKTYCQSIQIKGSSKMKNYKTYLQRCSLSFINFQQKISYIVYGSNSTNGTAVPFDTQQIQITMLHPNSTSETKAIILGDWSELHEKIGIYKSINETLDKLRTENKINAIIVNGDLAYDLDSNNGRNYEEFLNILSRSARFIPTFMIAGNHQHNSQDDQLLFYKTFQQYGAQQKFANSLNLGPFFLAAFDPYKTIYNTTKNYHLRKVDDALEGFSQALKNGSKTNKIIIPVSHYPLKCSASPKNCQQDTTILKDYFDLMFENNIKFYIGAHYHTYQRVYPYCKDGKFSIIPSPYFSDRMGDCMVSILEGIAGNDDKIVETYDKVKSYTAALSFGKTGVGLMTVNVESIKYQHFSSTDILTLQDQFQIIYKPNNKKLLQQ